MSRFGIGYSEVRWFGENGYEFMDEFGPNTGAQQAPQVFAAQAGFACAAPGRSHSRRMARPIKPMNIPVILNVHWYEMSSSDVLIAAVWVRWGHRTYSFFNQMNH